MSVVLVSSCLKQVPAVEISSDFNEKVETIACESLNPSSPYCYPGSELHILLHLLLHTSSPNSEKCRFVPFSRDNHSGFALNDIPIPDHLE